MGGETVFRARAVEGAVLPARAHAAAARRRSSGMPRTMNIPRQSDGAVEREQQRAADVPAAAPAPAPSPQPNAPPLGAGASGPSGVTVKLEAEEEEEEEEGPRRDGAAPGTARVPATGSHAAPAAEPAPAPHHDAPAAGAEGSGVTQVKVEEAEKTLGQQRDRLTLALAHGPVRVDSHIKVEDTDGDDTDWEVEVGPGGTGGDGEGEGGLVLLPGAAHVPADDGERGGGVGASRRSTPADRAARAKRGRGDVPAGDNAPDAPPPKRKQGGAQVGMSGRHGVIELTRWQIRKATPWLTWRARLQLPFGTQLQIGSFPSVDDAARAYDAEVRRRGWAHVRALNFPQPEELAAYTQAEERCDERGLPLSLVPEQPAGTHIPAATHGAPGQRPPQLSGQKPGKSGFFGVSKERNKCYKSTPWRVDVSVRGAKREVYVVGYFAIKKDAARAYDAEIRRRGWTLGKRLNYLDPADGDALPPSSAGAQAPGPG